MDGKDGLGLKAEKVEPAFSSFIVMPKISPKKLLDVKCFLMKFDRYLLHDSAGAFCTSVKGQNNDFSTELA